MSEQETDRNALTLYAPNHPAQVQSAGRQLGIAAQLNQDLERRRLVSILKRIRPGDAVDFLSNRRLDGSLIEQFADRWVWKSLSWSSALPWSLKLIDRFVDRWDWEYLSQNQTLPWSIELIERFENRWIWKHLSWNSALPWSFELVERYKDRWNWVILAETSDLPWSVELIELYKGRLSGGWFGRNSYLPWSIELIERYEDRWDWSTLSSNKALPWSLELIERYKDRWVWFSLSTNKVLPWSLELIERYEDHWVWHIIAQNKALPWSLELIERFADRWDWLCLASNSALPWSLELIERFGDRWGQGMLAGNSDLPWSVELIERYKDRWRWGEISNNSTLPWSIEFVDRFKDCWVWSHLSRSGILPWSIEFIERFEDRWEWKFLSRNKALPLSLDLIDHFADRWDWGWLSRNKALALPVLSPADIVEILDSHFTESSDSRIASPFTIDANSSRMDVAQKRQWRGSVDGVISNRKREQTPALSPNTRAILLLTAPLTAGSGTLSSKLLTPTEFSRLARHLRELQRQPSDLISPDSADLLRACRPVVDETRLQHLLGRDVLLSQAVAIWQARAIWVLSIADAEYPSRLKIRLKEAAPAVIYGCGDVSLLESGGLALVGTRDVDDSLIDYTMSVGRLAALAGRTVLSGGARGVDQAAMRGSIEAGGKFCGVLADSLEKRAMNPENRNPLLDGQLLLISPYDPSAGFNVGNTMQGNKLIYALADSSLVVSCDLDKGGIWAGAVEQLDKLKLVPMYVRSSGETSVGLDALCNKGAIPWPNPHDADAFEEVVNMAKNQ